MAAYLDHRDECWRYRKRITLPTGKKIRIKGTPPINTKVSAEQAERDHIERLVHPERFRAYETELVAKPASGTPTVREFAKKFLAEYVSDKASANRTRKVHINASIVPFFGALRLDQIDQSHVNAFRATIRNLASSTQRNKLVALSVMLGYAADLGLIPPHILKLHVKVSTETEINALPLASIVKLVEHAPDARYVVAILLASEAGLRIGEVRGAQWSDIKDGKITIRRQVDERNQLGPPKNGKPRTIRLSAGVQRALKTLPRRGIWLLTRLEDDEESRRGQKRVSEPGGFLGYSGMFKTMGRIYGKAGIEKSDDINLWHSLRHSFGTELVARGVPLPTVQRLMGHADIRTTMRYVTTTAEQMDAAIDKAFG